MSELDIKARAPVSLWHNNPSLVHLLGLSPLLAVSDSATKGAALGAGTLATCIASALAVWLLQKLIDEKWRYLWFSVILASFGSLILLGLQLYWYPLSRELGVYSVLIVCNLALLLQMDNYYRQESVVSVLKTSSSLGAGILLALLLFSCLREILISGVVFEQWQLLQPGSDLSAVTSSASSERFRFVRLQPAAFILLGLLIALGNRLNVWPGALDHQQKETQVARARVSGALKNASGSNEDE